LNIHFGFKTDVDKCCISLMEKNTSDHCKKTFGHIQRITCLGMTGCMSTTTTAAMKTLLGLPPLQPVVEILLKQFKKSDWVYSAIFKMATEDFPVLLAPSDSMLPLEVFYRKYLLEYPSKEIWLSEAAT
jgi:hypothetical protein